MTATADRRRRRQRKGGTAMHRWKWLYPGIGVKRWLLVMGAGVVLVSAGVALLVNIEFLGALERSVVRSVEHLAGPLPGAFPAVLGTAVVLAGFALIAVAFRRTVRSLLEAISPGKVDNLADVLYERQYLRRGPKVVVLGGGTGLATMLRGLKRVTSNITAIVTVADDGGSSGILRDEMGVLPPGDIRNTLVAMAHTESLMEKLFQYRFDSGNGLKGHTFGNLFIAAMTAITGDFEQAVRESSKVLAVRGRVLPSTLQSVTLSALFEDGSTVSGESRLAQHGARIRQVSLHPPDAAPLAEAVRALREADVIVLGPGSLYTSVLPNLLVPGITRAIRGSRALKLYVCNVMTQPGETDDYTASDHVRAILDHAGTGIVDCALVHRGRVPSAAAEKYRRSGGHPVVPDVREIREMGVQPVVRALAGGSSLFRHDAQLLAAAIMELWETDKAARKRAARGRRPGLFAGLLQRGRG